jgi:hypothetical protein
MASYQDFNPDPTWTAEQMYQEIENLIIGNYSVEVVRVDATKRIFRVWQTSHCDLSKHTKI